MDDSEMETLPGCTFFHRHPLLLCTLFFLAFLYAFFYPLFAFLLTSSPVLLFTTCLLGVVLFHSVPQEHDQHVYKKISRSQPVQCHITSTTATAGARHSNRSHRGSAADSPPTTSVSDTQPAIMTTANSLASFPDATGDDSESDSEAEPEHREQKHRSEEVVRAVAWTADDAKSIENIGSLELERNAAVEKLMSRRFAARRQPHRRRHHHIAADLDGDASRLTVHVVKSKPFDLDDDFPGSTPSMLLHPSRSNPFFDDDDDDDNELLRLHRPQPQQQSSSPGVSAQKKNDVLFRWHESFMVGAPYASDFRPSRFRPYFVTEKMPGQPVTVPEAGGKMSSSSSSLSSSSAGCNAYASVSANKEEEEEAAEQEALIDAEAAAMLETKTDDHREFIRPHEVVAVGVELISDSSDDDISLPEQMKVHQQQQQVVVSDQDDDNERESFEIESITKEVAAAAAEGKGKQLDSDPAHDYSPSAGTMEKQQQQDESLDQLPPMAPPTMAQTNKLASMRRVFSEDEADEPWAAPSRLGETTATEKEAREQDMFPLPPLPESAPAAGAAPLAAAAKKAAGKSSKYKPPSKKSVLGFFRK